MRPIPSCQNFLFILIAISFMTNCGNTKFSSKGGLSDKAASSDAVSNSGSAGGDDSGLGSSKKGDDDLNSSGDGKLVVNWSFDCNTPKAQMGLTTDPLTFSNSGIHAIDAKPYSEITVNNLIEFCSDKSLARDILLIVDVSGSTSTLHSGKEPTDPKMGNDCNRNKAVQKILASFAESSATRFALITFSTNVVANSRAFYANKEDLAQKLTGSKSIDNLNMLLCSGNGFTNYTAPLQAAQGLLKADFRAEATREIYFISDGMPHPETEDGAEVAAQLKENGITANDGSKGDVYIATILFGDEAKADATPLKNLASLDSNNKPYHMSVENASQLPESLGQLAEIKPVSGEFRYRAKGESYHSIELNEKMNEPTISLDPIKIPGPFSEAALYDFIFEIKDSAGRAYRKQGGLTQKD